MIESDHMMSPDARQAIEARAADYFQRRRFQRWTGAEQAELDAWLEESTAHRVIFLRLEARAARIEKLADLRPPSLNRTIPVSRLRFSIPFLAAAGVSLLAILGFAAERYFAQAPTADHVTSTEVGGRALVSFADNTQVELNTNTIVRYRITTAERTVWLEKGEAWFRVAHDASRPFNVIVGDHRITDLGTEFLVRRGADDVEVALLKGRAALSAGGMKTAMLAPGDDAVATPISVSVTKKTPQELADALAWQRGVLVFRNARLADAVREFNRYFDKKLAIADPSIADLKFSAEVRLDHIDGFLELARTVLDLRVDSSGDTILLSRGPREKKKAARTAHGA